MILLTLGFGLVGTLFLCLGLLSLYSNHRLLRRCSEVGEGVVSGFTEPSDEGCVRPRVRLVHVGDTIIITGAVGSCPPGYQVGQRVVVRYPSGKPGMAVIADFQQLYLLQVAMIGFGALGVGAAALSLDGVLPR